MIDANAQVVETLKTQIAEGQTLQWSAAIFVDSESSVGVTFGPFVALCDFVLEDEVENARKFGRGVSEGGLKRYELESHALRRYLLGNALVKELEADHSFDLSKGAWASK